MNSQRTSHINQRRFPQIPGLSYMADVLAALLTVLLAIHAGSK